MINKLSQPKHSTNFLAHLKTTKQQYSSQFPNITSSLLRNFEHYPCLELHIFNYEISFLVFLIGLLTSYKMLPPQIRKTQFLDFSKWFYLRCYLHQIQECKYMYYWEYRVIETGVTAVLFSKHKSYKETLKGNLPGFLELKLKFCISSTILPIWWPVCNYLLRTTVFF